MAKTKQELSQKYPTLNGAEIDLLYQYQQVLDYCPESAMPPADQLNWQINKARELQESDNRQNPKNAEEIIERAFLEEAQRQFQNEFQQLPSHEVIAATPFRQIFEATQPLYATSSSHKAPLEPKCSREERLFIDAFQGTLQRIARKEVEIGDGLQKLTDKLEDEYCQYYNLLGAEDIIVLAATLKDLPTISKALGTKEFNTLADWQSALEEYAKDPELVAAAEHSNQLNNNFEADDPEEVELSKAIALSMELPESKATEAADSALNRSDPNDSCNIDYPELARAITLSIALSSKSPEGEEIEELDFAVCDAKHTEDDPRKMESDFVLDFQVQLVQALKDMETKSKRSKEVQCQAGGGNVDEYMDTGKMLGILLHKVHKNKHTTYHNFDKAAAFLETVDYLPNNILRKAAITVKGKAFRGERPFMNLKEMCDELALNEAPPMQNEGDEDLNHKVALTSSVTMVDFEKSSSGSSPPIKSSIKLMQGSGCAAIADRKTLHLKINDPLLDIRYKYIATSISEAQTEGDKINVISGHIIMLKDESKDPLKNKHYKMYHQNAIEYLQSLLPEDSSEFNMTSANPDQAFVANESDDYNPDIAAAIISSLQLNTTSEVDLIEKQGHDASFLLGTSD